MGLYSGRIIVGSLRNTVYIYIFTSTLVVFFQWEKPPIISGKRRQDRNSNNSSFLSRTFEVT